MLIVQVNSPPYSVVLLLVKKPSNLVGLDAIFNSMWMKARLWGMEIQSLQYDVLLCVFVCSVGWWNNENELLQKTFCKKNEII